MAAPAGAAALGAIRVSPPDARTSLSQQKPATVYKPGNGVMQPTLVKHAHPNYPRKAKDRKIQGVVWLSAVVLENGKVQDVTVTKSLDREFGLDDEAVKSVKKWRFKPGTMEGKPVAVEIEVEMSFTLSDR